MMDVNRRQGRGSSCLTPTLCDSREAGRVMWAHKERLPNCVAARLEKALTLLPSNCRLCLPLPCLLPVIHVPVSMMILPVQSRSTCLHRWRARKRSESASHEQRVWRGEEEIPAEEACEGERFQIFGRASTGGTEPKTGGESAAVSSLCSGAHLYCSSVLSHTLLLALSF